MKKTLPIWEMANNVLSVMSWLAQAGAKTGGRAAVPLGGVSGRLLGNVTLTEGARRADVGVICPMQHIIFFSIYRNVKMFSNFTAM